MLVRCLCPVAEDTAEANRGIEVEAQGKSLKQSTSVEEAMVFDTTNIATESKFELNFKKVKSLQEQGASIKSIHRQTGLHRQTIKRYLESSAKCMDGKASGYCESGC